MARRAQAAREVREAVVPSVCDGTATRLLAAGDGIVDNFEGPMIAPGWSSFNDVMPTANSFKIAQEAGGAVGTGHFGHYAGMGAKTPLLGGYGVGTIFNEAIDVAAGIYCVDISGFDGVSFYAKAATAGAKVGVNFILPETNAVATDPTLGGGDCKTACYNHPYKTITLTTTWAHYAVTFAEAGDGERQSLDAHPDARLAEPRRELGFLARRNPALQGDASDGPRRARRRT